MLSLINNYICEKMGKIQINQTEKKYNYILFCNGTNITNPINELVKEMQDEGKLLLIKAARDRLTNTEIVEAMKHAANNAQIIFYSHGAKSPAYKESVSFIYRGQALSKIKPSDFVNGFIKNLEVDNISLHIVSCFAAYGTNEIAKQLTNKDFIKFKNFNLYLHGSTNILSQFNAEFIIKHILNSNFENVQSKYEFMRTLKEIYFFTNAIHAHTDQNKLICKTFVQDKLSLNNLDLLEQATGLFNKLYNFYNEINKQKENTNLKYYEFDYQKSDLKAFFSNYIDLLASKAHSSSITGEDNGNTFITKTNKLMTFISYFHDLVKINAIEQTLYDEVIMYSVSLHLNYENLLQDHTSLAYILKILLIHPVHMLSESGDLPLLLSSLQLKNSYTKEALQDNNIIINCPNENAFVTLSLFMSLSKLNNENFETFFNKVNFDFNFTELSEFTYFQLHYLSKLDENYKFTYNILAKILKEKYKLSDSNFEVSRVEHIYKGLNSLELQGQNASDDDQEVTGGKGEVED